MHLLSKTTLFILSFCSLWLLVVPECVGDCFLDFLSTFCDLTFATFEDALNETSSAYCSDFKTFPTEIGLLSKLTDLILGFARDQAGPIPSELAQLTNLNILGIMSVTFNETIPATIGLMSNLEQLIFTDLPLLTGNLGMLTQLSSLEFFYMADLPGVTASLTNDFLLNSSNLSDVTLESLKVSGEIPVSFGTLPIIALSIVDTELNGTIPDLITLNPALTALELSKNSLFDEFPNFQDGISSINLAENKLFGTLPDQLFGLFHLSLLNIGDNDFTGEISNNISHLQNLTQLDLSDNLFSGNLPEDIFSLSILSILKLEKNLFAAQTISSQISNLLKLTALNLAENTFSGNILDALLPLENLRQLTLDSNAFNGTVPLNIGRLSKLSALDFSNNFFAGVIPANFSELVSLRALKLGNNRFEGTLDNDVFDRIPLTNLNLSHNNFAGKFPEVYATSAFIFLREVDISNNLFTSGFDFGKTAGHSSMRILNARGNRFHQTLFSNIDFLDSLTHLDLSDNKFFGSFPSDVRFLNQLEYLNISFNNFTSTFPSNIDNLSNLRYLFVKPNNFIGTFPDFDNTTIESDCFPGEVFSEIIEPTDSPTSKSDYQEFDSSFLLYLLIPVGVIAVSIAGLVSIALLLRAYQKRQIVVQTAVVLEDVKEPVKI